MEEKCEIAERILSHVMEMEYYIRELDMRFEKTVFACGPSGYVGCSNECRGAGDRRRSGFMEDIAEYLNALGKKKDRVIISLKPVVQAFEELKGTRSGHVIFFRVGKGLSVQEYADTFHYSRRHARRLYLQAMADFYQKLAKYDTEGLIEKFRQKE
jgi:hypothetical protein